MIRSSKPALEQVSNAGLETFVVMAGKKKFFKGISYGLGRVGIAVCDLGAKALPLACLYGFANFIGSAGYRLAARHRRIAIEGLTMAFAGEKSPRAIEEIARECFRQMAATAVEFFMFMRFPDRIRRFVEIEGLENLDRALAQGKGVVAVSAHFGSFPLLLSRLAQEGYKVHSLLRHMRDEKLDKLFEGKRDRMRVGSIYTQPRQACVTRSLKVLRNNEVLFVQLDQNFGTAGVFVDFFGRKAATATGPVVFSLRTGAPLVPLFIHRLKGARHKIVIEPELRLRQDDDNTVLRAIEDLTVLIERYIRRYPHEWGWIHKRWKAKPKEEGIRDA